MAEKYFAKWVKLRELLLLSDEYYEDFLPANPTEDQIKQFNSFYWKLISLDVENTVGILYRA